MNSFHTKALLAITTFALAGCTQEQQSNISSSNWRKKLEKPFVSLERTGNWMNTERKISNLQGSVLKSIDNGSVTQEQAASLRNSMSYIRRLQQRSINSANGINASEVAQIEAAVSRVKRRLDGWLMKN